MFSAFRKRLVEATSLKYDKQIDRKNFKSRNLFGDNSLKF